jgi:hypothetical protein
LLYFIIVVVDLSLCLIYKFNLIKGMYVQGKTYRSQYHLRLQDLWVHIPPDNGRGREGAHYWMAHLPLTKFNTQTKSVLQRASVKISSLKKINSTHLRK